MRNLFLCLGGTGTQIGTAIGNLYPLLGQSGIISEPFEMFIIDKDTRGGNFDACCGARDRYAAFCELLPFECLPPYSLNTNVYQEMQEAAGNTGDYSVMDLIGKDDPDMRALASMCWNSVKQTESLKEGNNRDPSRGGLDALVCLENLQNTSLFERLNEAKGGAGGEENTRVVILGGLTGGTGSSLIKPLWKKIHAYFPKARIDIVALGPYFKIPERGLASSEVDDIGTTAESFYRAADQIDELREFVDNDQRVYYAALPVFDDTAGVFEKNGARKRSAHLLELIAALAAFGMEALPGEFYRTALDSLVFIHDDTTKLVRMKEAAGEKISWKEIPCGNEIRESATNFMRLVSVLACAVYPRLCQEGGDLKNDQYLRMYFGNPAKKADVIAAVRDELKTALGNILPYFMFWDEIQNYTQFGGGATGAVGFFPLEDMKNLSGFVSLTQKPWGAFLPLCGTNFEFFQDFKPDKRTFPQETDARSWLRLMIADMYKKVLKLSAGGDK
jgi:hypothetical protein